MEERPTLRWLLRVLGDDLFLPIYLRDPEPEGGFTTRVPTARFSATLTGGARCDAASSGCLWEDSIGTESASLCASVEPATRFKRRQRADEQEAEAQKRRAIRRSFHREVELSFWAIASDAEHPEDSRREAWEVLRSLIGSIEIERCTSHFSVTVAFYERVVHHLDAKLTAASSSHLARFWGWPELGERLELVTSAIPTPVTDYHEIHAHFRGSIPFDHLWVRMITDARARNVLSRERCKSGSWSQTRAELMEVASTLRRKLAGRDARIDEPALRRYCQRCPNLQAVQYLALYANLRRFLIHQRGSTGLVSFTKSFDRISDLSKGHGRRNVDRETVRAILTRFERSGATAVELRPTLENTRLELQPKLEAIVLGYFEYLAHSKAERPVAMGIVPSLFKQQTVTREAKKVHGRSTDDGLRARLEGQQQVWRRQVESLLAVIDEVPALRLFIVGVDAAGLEQGSPIRALASAFARIQQYHREYNLEWSPPGRILDVKPWLTPSGGSPRCQPRALWDHLNNHGIDTGSRSIPHCRLGITVHVGEDFVDPTTGLREIWEAIEHLDLRCGDRIGHGIAASLDWDETSKRGRLRTLLDRRAHSAEIPSVQQANDDGAWRIRLCKPLGVHALDLAWSDRLLGHPMAHHRGAAETALVTSHALGVLPMHQAVHESLTNGTFPAAVMLPGVCFVDHDTLEPEHCCWIEVDDTWCARFEAIRQAVVAKLRGTGIVIESCPTSNCAVANLDEPPLFGLLEIPGLRVAVATDDPGVFDAWPEHELARLDVPEHAERHYRERILRENESASFVRRSSRRP